MKNSSSQLHQIFCVKIQRLALSLCKLLVEARQLSCLTRFAVSIQIKLSRVECFHSPSLPLPCVLSYHGKGLESTFCGTLVYAWHISLSSDFILTHSLVQIFAKFFFENCGHKDLDVQTWSWRNIKKNTHIRDL